MANTLFLVIEGRNGPSKRMTNAIEISSFSFGANNSSRIGKSTESREGGGNVSDVQVTKDLDKTSPLLFDDCVTGDLYTKVEIIKSKQEGNALVDFFKILMEGKVLVTSWSISGAAEGQPMESVTFAFEKVKVCYNAEEEGAEKGYLEKGFHVLESKAY